MKPFLSSKTTNHSQVTLVEYDKVINDDTKVAETLNSFFTEAALNLKIPEYKTSSIVMDENKSNKDIDIDITQAKVQSNKRFLVFLLVLNLSWERIY